MHFTLKASMALTALASCIRPVMSLPTATNATSSNSTSSWNATSPSCTNPSVRKEWGSLTLDERSAYINAVLCMKQQPSRIPAGEVPGAQSYFDDFAAAHINQTRHIHFDGIFLPWHRNFVHIWETALQDTCGYTGVQPYWDWPLWQSRGGLAASPLFDGSATSLGGDGWPTTSYNETCLGDDESGAEHCIARAPGGGGCVRSGPFVDFNVTMGPFELSQMVTGLPANWTDYNPHCLYRDLDEAEYDYMNYTTWNLSLAQPTYEEFEYYLTRNLTMPSDNDMGLHGLGHFVLGPSMFDLFASPFDPAFFLHHGGVDRLWTHWQNLDPQNRIYGSNAVYGTESPYNVQSTPWVTLDTVINWGVLGEPKTVGEIQSTLAGDYCYVYEN